MGVPGVRGWGEPDYAFSILSYNAEDLNTAAAMLGAALLIFVLALLLDGLFALLQHLVVPRGVTAGRVLDVRSSPTGRRAVVGTPAD